MQKYFQCLLLYEKSKSQNLVYPEDTSVHKELCLYACVETVARYCLWGAELGRWYYRIKEAS